MKLVKKPLLMRARRRLQAAWLALRFGQITCVVKAVDGGVPSEVEYRGRFDRVVGYWACGSFDPKLPYRGQ